MSDLNGLRQVDKKTWVSPCENCELDHTCVHSSHFVAANCTSALFLSVSPQRKSKNTWELTCPRLAFFWLLRFALAKRTSAGRKKIGDTFVHAFFVRFALAKRQKSKCVFFFCISPRRNAKKNGTAIVHAFSARFSLGKRAFFEPMLSKT